MKKTKRVLSFLMAVVMLSSVFSIMADAYASYRDAAITSYDDVDQPVFTLDQCSSMFLDYVDKMLRTANKDGELVIDLSVLGTLDLSSVDNALSGIYNLKNSILWPQCIDILADLYNLNVSAISSARRTSTPALTSDTIVIYSIIQFIYDNKDIFINLIDGSLDWGIVKPFGDTDKINVSQTLKKLLFGQANPGTAVPETVTDTADTMVQQILTNALAGSAASPLAGHVDINSESAAYDFLEELLQNVYNLVAVPLLNTDLKKAVREFCGVDYSDTAAYPNGDTSDLNEYADILNIDFTVPPHTFAADATLISDLNGILGEIASAVLKNYTGWAEGNNTHVLNNLAAAAKVVLKTMGSGLFPGYITVPSDAEIEAMDNQALFSYITRSAVNSWVSYMNIPASADTLTKVAWYAVKEILAQYIPANDYSAQPQTLDGILFMLADLAVYFINGRVDMNPVTGVLPGQGLLPYGQGFDATLTAVMSWFKLNFGKLFDLTLSTTNGWETLDTLAYSVVQHNWLPADITGCKDLFESRVLSDILNLNTDRIFALFTHRADSEFASKTIKKVLIDAVARVVNDIFPAAIAMAGNTSAYTSFDQIIDNANLKTTAAGIISKLNERKIFIVPAVLPTVVKLLKINVPEQFTAPEIVLPKQISAATTFAISNDSIGVNTGFTDKNGNFTQDALYRIKIDTITTTVSEGNTSVITATDLHNTVLNGGESVNCTLSGAFVPNGVLTVTMTYYVYTETGTKLTGTTPLTAMAFTYISNVSDDGRNYITLNPNDKNTHDLKYKNIYCNRDYNLADLAAQDVFVAERAVTSVADNYYTATVSRGLVSTNATLRAGGITAAPWAGNITTAYNGGSWSIPAFVVDPAATRPSDGAYGTTFNYTATKTSLTSNSEIFSFTHYVVFYDDLGLPALLSSELSAKRDPADYADSAAWDDYVSALAGAVAVCYRPRQAATFTDQIAYYYTFAKAALEEAIAALESGGPPIVITPAPMLSALSAIEPSNVDLEFDNPVYTWFGMADFVPYTYLRYSKVRDEMVKVIKSQTPPVEPVLPVNPTPDEIEAYNAAHAQWVIDLAYFNTHRTILKSIDVAYLIHRYTLYASRLIPVQADKTLLNAAITAVQDGVASRGLTASNSSLVSWAAYQRALAFANSVNAQSTTVTDSNGFYVLRPSKVIAARDRLIEAAKKLFKICDYTQLDALIEEASKLNQSDYTPEWWAKFKAAFNIAVSVPRELPYNAKNQTIIDEAAAGLRWPIEPPPPGPGFHVIPPVVIDTVNHYIFGFYDGASPLGNIIANPGFQLIWHSTNPCYGTGTTFDVVGINDGVIKSTWTIVIFGDVNGDSFIDAQDSDVAIDYANWLFPWDPSWQDKTDIFAFAGDLNNDGNLDFIDADIMIEIMNWVIPIDHIYWPL